MARVIKAGDAGSNRQPQRAPTRVIVDAGGKKVIERQVFAAKQDAEHILMRAQAARQARVAHGRKQAEQAREEAMTRGASEAFALAAQEALAAFRARAERYAMAADDIRVLALEVAKKVIGAVPDLSSKDVDAIVRRGLAALRARRRLRLQVNEGRLDQLAYERPNLMRALVNEPDLVIEAADDVNVGFARVVTEVGGALCTELSALDALAEAVNVKEAPREGKPRGGRVEAGTRPRVHAQSLRSDVVDALPDASIEELVDDDLEATHGLNIAASRSDRDIEEIQAQHDDISQTAPRPRAPTDHVPTGHVVAGSAHRPATRVVRIPDAANVPARAPPANRAAEEFELELFTDDAVPSVKR